MKKLFMIVFILNFMVQLNAQTRISDTICDRQIVQKTNPIIPYSTYYVYKKKISHDQCAYFLKSYGPSAYEYQQRKKMLKYFSFSIYPTVLIYAASMAYSFSGERNKQPDVTHALLFGAFAGITTSLVFGIQAQRHHHKSIRLYNSAICDR